MMVVKIVVLLLALNYFGAESSVKVIDKHLQEFRREYREFRGRTRLQLDQSFFDIYNAVGLKTMEFEKPYERPQTKWLKICSKFTLNGVENSVKKSFIMVCENVENLLRSSLSVHHKVLETLFSGRLLKPSPPLVVFDELCDEIESQMEEIWKVYSANKTCVRKHLKEIIPLFAPFIRQIFNLTHATVKTQIQKDFNHCHRHHEKAVSYVNHFMKELESCESGECLKKVVTRTCTYMGFL
jgi:hypothetical protein